MFYSNLKCQPAPSPLAVSTQPTLQGCALKWSLAETPGRNSHFVRASVLVLPTSVQGDRDSPCLHLGPSPDAS